MERGQYRPPGTGPLWANGGHSPLPKGTSPANQGPAPSAPNDDITIFEAELPRESFDQILPPSDSADDPLVSVTLNGGFSGLVLMNPGRIKVRAYRGEDEIRLGTLRVRLRSEWEDEQRRAAEATKVAAN
jgi:hypothetical protein